LTPPPIFEDPGPTPPPVAAAPAPELAPIEGPSLAADAPEASQALTPPPLVVDSPEPAALEPPVVPEATLDVSLASQVSSHVSSADAPSIDDAAALPGAIVPDAVAELPLDGRPAPLPEMLSPPPSAPDALEVSSVDGTSTREPKLEIEPSAFSSQETPWPELTAAETPDSSAPAEASRVAADEPEVAVAEDLEEVDGADGEVTEPLDTLPAEALSEATPMVSALEPPAPPPRPAAAPPPLPAGSPRRKTGETRAPELPAAQVVASIVPPIPAGAATLPEALAQRPRRPRRSKPWFEEVFDEDYLRTLPFMSADQTLREVEFIESSLGVKPGGQLLDIGCGYGRHAIELAQRGLDVTGLDLSLPLLLRAADEAQKRSMSVNFVHADMREMAFEKQFDGIYSMLTSFGYFDEETNLRVAEGIARALKPGGRFLLDIVNRDYVVSDLPSRVWWEGNGCVVLEEVDFNFHTSRILTHRSIVFEDGRQIEQEISVRAYSLHEIGRLLRQAGFRVVDVSGSLATRGHLFGATSRNLLILAEKRTEET
jgi:SAM-dependent methyltransferase